MIRRMDLKAEEFDGQFVLYAEAFDEQFVLYFDQAGQPVNRAFSEMSTHETLLAISFAQAEVEQRKQEAAPIMLRLKAANNDGAEPSQAEAAILHEVAEAAKRYMRLRTLAWQRDLSESEPPQGAA
jgi:hypothetical protein